MKLLREYIRTLLSEGYEFRDLDSPLKYARASNIIRIALCDTSETEPAEKRDTYFTPQQEWEYYGRSGRRLKKPRKGDITAGVSDVCVVGFLDYHKKDENYYYIDYLKTRADRRGRKFASMLIGEFFERFAGPGVTIHFGKMMRKEVGYLKDKMAEKYPDTSVIGAKNF